MSLWAKKAAGLRTATILSVRPAAISPSGERVRYVGDEFPPFCDHHREEGREQSDGLRGPARGIFSRSVHAYLTVCAE
jgi:hypothetical protein